jgi:hypothetical protein
MLTAIINYPKLRLHINRCWKLLICPDCGYDFPNLSQDGWHGRTCPECGSTYQKQGEYGPNPKVIKVN